MAKKPIDDRSNMQIIREAIDQIPGHKKIAANGWIMIRCPFHDDSTPSCGIRVAEPNLGVFNCLGCAEKGGWNKLADKLGLEKIKSWNKTEDANDFVIPKDLDEKMLGATGVTFKQVIKHFGCAEATLWPEQIEWRGFSGKFMRKLGAHIINDSYSDSVSALFPVKVAGKVRGGVKAAYEKKKRSLSYITSGGSWVGDYGLFPFVYARSLIRKKKLGFIVVVEGPRDAMRLCLNGIPAVAVLGAKNVTKKKVLLLTSTGVDVVYVIPDEDEAGTMMWKLVKRLCVEQSIEVHKVKLPAFKDRTRGKMDPGNAPKKVIRRFIEHLEKRHNFVAPKEIQ